MGISSQEATSIVIGFDGVPDGTHLSQSAIDRLTGFHRWGQNSWFYIYSKVSAPAFGFSIPFTTNYSFTFYFRRRPQWMREQGHTAYVIDWPWVRYTGLY